MPAVSGGYFGAGRKPRRVPQKPAPATRAVRVAPPRPEVSVRAPRSAAPRGPQRAQSVNPAINPRAAGPIAPKQRVHIRRNTAITEPLSSPAFARQQRQAARHVARSVIRVATQGKSSGPNRPLYDHEVRAVLTSPTGRRIIASAERATRVPEQKHNRSLLSHAVGFVKSGGGLKYTLGAVPAAVGINPFKIQKTAAVAGFNTARAGVEDPFGVGAKTAGGFGQMAIGLVGAIPELAIRTAHGTAHGDPLEGVKAIGDQALKDYARRYGPLYRGDPGAAKAFRERIKQEGAAPELLDAATILAPQGAIAGRAAGKLAREGALGPRAKEFATAPRPALRISGDTARPQELSRNLIRVAGQRAEDRLRQRALERRNAKSAARDQPLSGLQPRTSRVVSPGRTVQVAGREVAVFDPRATRKALARHERRRVDRPFIREHEVTDFEKGAKYSGVMYHVTTPEAAKIVEKRGLDPAKAQRGTYGLGVYSASVPENIPGASHSVQVAVRMKRPLILTAEKAMSVLKPYREKAIASLREKGVIEGSTVETKHLRVLSAEMTRELQRKGYDGVVVKGAMRGGDYVVNFHPQDVRVVRAPEAVQRTFRGNAVWRGHAGDQPVRVTGFAGSHGGRDYMHVAGSKTAVPLDELQVPVRDVARRGGRTSAVLERNLPGDVTTRAARDVRVGEKTAPTREVVAMTKAGQRRLQRIESSKIASRVYEGFRNEQTREIDQGAMPAFSKLNKHQRVAAVSAIQGVVTAHDPAAAIRQLEARNKAILAERAADTAERAKHGLGPRPIPKGIHGDEIALNNYLIEHANEIFNYQFGEFQKAEAARSIRAAGEADNTHPAFKSSTAEARRLRPQGDALGVPYEYAVARNAIEDDFRAASRKVNTDAEVAAAAKERDAALAALEQRKPQIDAQYAAEVRAKAQAAGLPEPGFVAHHPRPEYGYSDRAPGGAKAIVGPRRSEMVLHRLGIADTHPARYVQSLARAIKYKYNWPGVAAQAEANAFSLREFGTQQELRDITGRKGRLNPDSLSIEDWRRILHAKGLNPGDYAFWNPGRLRKAKAEFDAEGHDLEHLDVGNGPEGSPGVHEGWQSAAVDEKALRDLPADQRDIFVKSRGWKLLPREAYNEITAGTRPSGGAARTVAKYQATQSRVLLGLNPSWLQIQVAANALQSAFGVAAKLGNPADFLTATRLYNRQPADVRRIIDEGLSNGVFAAHGDHVHLGASAGELALKLRAFGEHPVFQNAKRVNPMNVIFRADHAQNAYFRKVVLASSLKREAFNDMGKAIGLTADQQKKVAEVLAIKDPEARLRAIIRDPQLFEKHAEYVNRILGDYTRFTARERRYLKRGILFYGFMRYSLRTLFYTLPVKHPLAATAAAKLAQLHNEEVKELLGGPDAPWAYSRVFFGSGNKLRSIDFARMNPVTNPIVDVASEGPQALGGFISPAVQAVTDQLYGKSLYSGQEFKVKGSAEANPNPDVVTRGRIVAADILATAFPYREAVKLTQSGAKQGDDTLLFSPRPIQYKTAAAQARQQVRIDRSGSGAAQVRRDLFPLVQPKPDFTSEVMAERRRKGGKSVGGGGNRWGTSSPASSGGSGNRWGT